MNNPPRARQPVHSLLLILTLLPTAPDIKCTVFIASANQAYKELVLLEHDYASNMDSAKIGITLGGLQDGGEMIVTLLSRKGKSKHS